MDRSEYVQVARFIAALLVVVTHTTFYAVERTGSPFGIWHFGEIGVPIFFVISGIVMVLSAAQISAGVKGARIFLLRRFVRVVPLYWLATAAKVVIALAVPTVVNHNHFELDHAVKSFLFIPYFNAAGDIRPMHGVGWTLLHEVYFYLLFAAALAAGRRPIVWVSSLICGAWFVGIYLPEKTAFLQVATNPINLNFVVGMVAGQLLVSGLGSAKVQLLGVAAAAAAWLLVGTSAGVVLSFAVSVTLLAHRRFSSKWRPVVALGDSSYSLYLFHPFIAPALVMLFGKKMDFHPILALVSTCVLTVAIAHLLHVAIERPVVRRVRNILTARGIA